MGWGNCGTDSQGRPIGYLFEATCDHPDCAARINRGLSYECGQMHGSDEISCERYFCEHHRNHHLEHYDGRIHRICDDCAAQLLDSGDWIDDNGLIIPNRKTE